MNQPVIAGTACVICDSPPGTTGVPCPVCGFSGIRMQNGTYRSGATMSEIAYPASGSDQTCRVEEGSFWFRHRNRLLTDLIARFPSLGPLLDVGGGNGYPARVLQELRPTLVLVEPMTAGVANAMRRGVRKIVNGTLESLGLRDGVVGGVCLLDVLEHLPDPGRALDESFRVLAPGGRLYVTVPALGFLWSDEDEYARHSCRYSAASLSRELTYCGFEIDFISYCFRILTIPVFLLRVLPYRLLGTRSQAVHPHEHAPARPLALPLAAALEREARKLSRGEPLPFGTSLICAARKPAES